MLVEGYKEVLLDIEIYFKKITSALLNLLSNLSHFIYLLQIEFWFGLKT